MRIHHLRLPERLLLNLCSDPKSGLAVRHGSIAHGQGVAEIDIDWIANQALFVRQAR